MANLYVRKLSSQDLDALQTYVAAASVGPSTVRSYPGETKSICQRHLSSLNLRPLRQGSPSDFRTFLTRQTQSLIRKLSSNSALPIPESYFGVARKVVNIFLHNAYYNQFLCEHFSLWRHVESYEVPLDSKVARGIRADSRSLGLAFEPSWEWSSLRAFDASTNQRYQELARAIAESMATYRVHLDDYYYPGGFLWAFDT